MSKVKVSGNPAIDPTLPKVEWKVEDKTYFLCYTFKAIALAEAKLREQGVVCNLYQSLDVSSLDATKLSNLLYAGLITHKPSITIEEVFDLITFKNMYEIPGKILEAYAASLGLPSEDEKPVDPIQPEV